MRNFPVPDTGAPYEAGTYEVCVTSANGQPGAYRVTGKPRPPRLRPQRVTEAMLAGVSPRNVHPGDQIRLKVVGADPVLSNNVVMLDGAEVAIDEGSLRNGKGTLTVTLPGATPIGMSAVYFISDGEKSNEVAFEVTP